MIFLPAQIIYETRIGHTKQPVFKRTGIIIPTAFIQFRRLQDTILSQIIRRVLISEIRHQIIPEVLDITARLFKKFTFFHLF